MSARCPSVAADHYFRAQESAEMGRWVTKMAEVAKDNDSPIIVFDGDGWVVITADAVVVDLAGCKDPDRLPLSLEHRTEVSRKIAESDAEAGHVA